MRKQSVDEVDFYSNKPENKKLIVILVRIFHRKLRIKKIGYSTNNQTNGMSTPHQ